MSKPPPKRQVAILDLIHRADFDRPDYVYRLVRGRREIFIGHDGAVAVHDDGKVVAFHGPPASVEAEPPKQ